MFSFTRSRSRAKTGRLRNPELRIRNTNYTNLIFPSFHCCVYTTVYEIGILITAKIYFKKKYHLPFCRPKKKDLLFAFERGVYQSLGKGNFYSALISFKKLLYIRSKRMRVIHKL